jgi:hypothetical protein
MPFLLSESLDFGWGFSFFSPELLGQSLGSKASPGIWFGKRTIPSEVEGHAGESKGLLFVASILTYVGKYKRVSSERGEKSG